MEANKRIAFLIISLLVLFSCSKIFAVKSNNSDIYSGSNQNSSIIKKETSLVKAKTITIDEAEKETVDKSYLEYLSSFSNSLIENVRKKQYGETFVFSPLSYYLSLSSLYSLCLSNNDKAFNLLGADSQEELISFVGNLTRRIFESDNNPNKPKRIMISNLVADYTNAFNEQEIDKITNTLYASYIDNPNTINNDLDSFMSEISNGKIEKYPFNKPKIDSTSFISSLYVDIPYPLVFNSNTIKMPFNGMGEYDYFRSDQNISELTINDDYLAFKMGNLRFVKPINDSLDDFFLNHSFDGCFQKNNHEEQKVILGIPKISIDSPLELLDIAKENGFLNDNSIEFNEDNLPYFIDNLTQDNYVSFSDSGVRAYSANIMGVIPYNAPVASINLDTSYAFEITGRDDIVLFYGEVNSLENAN